MSREFFKQPVENVKISLAIAKRECFNEHMDAKEAILERKAKLGSLQAVADQCGVKYQYLWGILKDKWPASDKVLKGLGLERRERIVRQKAVSE